MVESLLPELKGKKVIDLGCGFGRTLGYFVDKGVEKVVGLEISEKMLDVTRKENEGALQEGKVELKRQDLDALEFTTTSDSKEKESYDLAFSSLVVHYLDDLPRFLSNVHACLAKGGLLVYSTEHPVTTSATSAPHDWIEADGKKVWPLHGYLTEGTRENNWLGSNVRKQHRTIAAHVNALIEAGFVVEKLIEWGPSLEQVKEHPEWEVERERPYFLMLRARKA